MSKAADLIRSVRGGQLYRAFPFSNCSLHDSAKKFSFECYSRFYQIWTFQFHQTFICYYFHLLLYFIEYNVHTSIVHTWISQYFWSKKWIIFFKNNFTRINDCKFIHHTSHRKPFLSYLPCIVRREYFGIIFHVKSAHYTG